MRETEVDILVPYSGQGGVEIVINQVIRYLKQNGFQIRVVELVWDGNPWLDTDVDFYPLRRDKVENIEQFTDMYGVFLQERGIPDLVLATPWPFLAYVAKKALTILGNDHACRVISWLHAPMQIYEKYGVGGYERLAFADRVFCLTHAEENRVNHRLGEGKAVMVYNPIDTSQIGVLEAENCNEPKLVYVGRLSEEKRVDTLIRALAMAKSDWNLTIVGDGESREKLQELADSLGVETKIEWLGWREHPWAEEQVLKADFMVLPSEYEGFALVLVEALAAGIPVISTPVGVAPELIRPGENGYLFETGQEMQLQQILDCIADSVLPKPDREICKNSVVSYEMSHALFDFQQKLLDTL